MITRNYKHLGLFEGIGGFSIAAHWMGWETSAWCEWNPFGQHVLKSLFPEAEGFSDITKTDFTKYANKIDILTGGFPCQPFSTAGKRAGTDDARYLWPEMLRAIREIRPRWVIGENVYGLVNWDGGLVFDTVCADLENEGFEVWPVVLPAAGVNAPHRRDRIWFIARNTQLHGRIASENGGTDNKSPFTPGENQVGQSAGTDSVQSARVFTANNNQFNGDLSGFYTGEVSQFKEAGIQPDPHANAAGLQTTGAEQPPAGFAGNDAWPSQDPNSDGRGGDQWQSKPVIREQRHIGTGDNERLPANDGETGADAHTEGCGMEGGGATGQQEPRTPAEPGLPGRYGTTNDWTIWPTVSPLCSGDDGLSDLLDADTVSEVAGKKVRNAFSWWRQESIKAGGNAIVPEVAYQIFKTIELFEDQLIWESIK